MILNFLPHYLMSTDNCYQSQLEVHFKGQLCVPPFNETTSSHILNKFACIPGNFPFVVCQVSCALSILFQYFITHCSITAFPDVEMMKISFSIFFILKLSKSGSSWDSCRWLVICAKWMEAPLFMCTSGMNINRWCFPLGDKFMPFLYPGVTVRPLCELNTKCVS